MKEQTAAFIGFLKSTVMVTTGSDGCSKNTSHVSESDTARKRWKELELSNCSVENKLQTALQLE